MPFAAAAVTTRSHAASKIAWTEGLPESDIEFASWRPAPRQPRHDHSVSHPPLSAQMRVCRTATAPLSARPAHYAFFIESTGAYP